jgi:hypothetical protein
MPETIFYSTSNTDWAGGNDYTFALEERNTRYMNLHHSKILNGDSGKQTTQLRAGMHSVGLHVYMQQNNSTDTEIDPDGNGLHTHPDYTFKGMHRVRLCCRHADMLTLL